MYLGAYFDTLRWLIWFPRSPVTLSEFCSFVFRPKAEFLFFALLYWNSFVTIFVLLVVYIASKCYDSKHLLNLHGQDILLYKSLK
jgi:hypothetical protein